jgi:hypothetical protein
MATLINERFRFLHLPKTGGTWAMEAMWAAGVVAARPTHVPDHAGLAETRDFSDRFTFAFIRHPLEFWLSYWGYRMRTGWDPDHQIDAAAGSADFGKFVDTVVEQFAGAASEVYERYVGRPGEEIDFIGRHERLTDDVCAALQLAGEEFDEDRLRSHPPVNCTDFSRHPAGYTPESAARMAAAEGVAIERFYAYEPIPSRLLGLPTSTEDRGKRRLQRATIELRDARAELSVLKAAERKRLDLIERQAHELVETREALSSLRSSHLVRWSRPLRVSWYAWQGRGRPTSEFPRLSSPTTPGGPRESTASTSGARREPARRARGVPSKTAT